MNLMTLIVRLFVALPFFYGWKKIKASLAFFFGSGCLSEIIGVASDLSEWYTPKKGYVHHNFFLLFSSVAIFYFYSNMYKFPRNWFFSISVVYLTFFGLTSYFIINNFQDFNTYTYSFFHFIMIIFSFIGFYRIFNSENLVFIEKSAFFWLNSAFLFFSAGAIVFTIFSRYLVEVNTDLDTFFWKYFFGSLCIVFYSVVTYAFTLKDDKDFPIFRDTLLKK